MAEQKVAPAKKDEFEPQVLDIARVARVATGGRRFRFRAVLVAGDGKGRVGIGVAKGKDVAQAVSKATQQAKKNLVTVPVAGHTILHPVEAKFGASHVILRPQREGRGMVAGGPVRVLCEKAGIKDISAKFLSRSHSKLNNAMAVMKAFSKLRGEVEQPKEEHADTSD